MSGNLHAPLCGIFHPNSVVVASAGLTSACKPGALVLKWGNRMEEI
ncbi:MULTISPECIES: DUF6783 domain-containing protein [Blautia]